MKLRKLLLLAIACILVGGIGAGLTWKSYAETTNEVKERATEKIEANENIKKIQVKLDAGDVKIQKGNDSSFYIEKSAMMGNQEITVEESGDTLTIQSDMEKGISFDFSFLSTGFKAPKITVIVPERMYDEINVSTEAGDVTVVDLDSEQVNISTSAGDITVQNIAASAVEGISKAGEIYMNNITGEVVAKTMGGDVEVVDHDPDYSVMAESKAGDVAIHLVETPKNATVRGETTAGDVKVFDQEDEYVKIGKGEVDIKGETLAGDVTIGVR